MLVSFIFALLSILISIFKTLPELKENNAFDIIEGICIIWFCTELILRFIVSPNKLRFFKTFITITDLLSVLPYFVCLILKGFSLVEKIKNISIIFRCFSFIHIARFFSSMRVLGKTMKNSLRELVVYFVYLAIGILVFSSIVYYVESDVHDTSFKSIPASLW